MALEKTSIPINFAQGVDQKTDPFQVAPGKMLSLKNAVFTKAGRLSKRNGYSLLASLPNTTFSRVTNYNDNLTAIGTRLSAYSASNSSWVDKGALQQASLSVISTVRSATNHPQADSAMDHTGLVCTAYTESSSGSLVYKYSISDSITGQNIIPPTLLSPTTGTVSGSPRVFVLGQHFIIVFTVNSGGDRLQYTAISTNNPTIVNATVNITANYTAASTVAFDGVVANNNLYIGWNGADGAMHMTYIDSTLLQHNTVNFATQVATSVGMTADLSGTSPIIWMTYYDSASTNGYALAVDGSMLTILAPTQIITGLTVRDLTASASNGVLTSFYEIINAYSYDASIKTDYISSRTVTQAGVLGTATVVARSVGLASKAFIVDSKVYFLSVYDSGYQPTYFLLTATGEVVSKLAYSNGGGYLSTGLPSVTVIGNTASVSYLYRDLVQGVNKSQGVANTLGVYSQTGVNLVTFDLKPTILATAEIGQDLHLSGGFMWMYDGVAPVEHGFHLWPDYVKATTSTTGGLITAQQYYYQAVYEWTDARGNIFRSAPSLPVGVVTTGSTSTNTVNVPTLRLTYKTATPIKIVLYRWSTAQQTYYQVTSITLPTLNNTAVDSVAFTDIQADSAILGNSILYTTGGVIENIAPPATDIMALYKSRLVMVDSENRNSLWFSKQVIQNTPVEMSDLFTVYIAPTTAAQGNTGPVTALSALDDKLIIFKKDAIYYMTGTGPDNTGINNDFSEPVFITSTIGCTNQQSIVFMPSGLMFQSDKGIWLLGRDLSTSYVGAPVEDYNQDNVQSAVNVPGTNEVRFTLDSGITLMYDYYFGQWGTFTNIPAVSSTLYNGLHTYIDQYGRAFQESPKSYLDGSRPVLMSFKTSWLNLAGLQGYERAYFFYLLGVYLTPHKLSLEIAYDYSDSPSQTTMITPSNYTPAWGGEQLWGSGGGWGGDGNIEQHRVFLQQQKCQAFQITLTEIYDPSKGVAPGAGLTLSGINAIVGVKSNYPRLKASKSVG